ncbi:MAG: YbfB/YjiJ family MFS transporter [Mesorhizobium sp.]
MKIAATSPLRFALAGMVGMAAAMGIGRFVYTPILPGMMEGLHLSAADAGLIASANFLGYLVGAYAAAGGWAHGRERATMLAGLAASTLLAAAMGLTGDLAAFLVIRFLAGVASAFVMVFLTAIVSSHLDSTGRGGMQALHFGGVGLGIALSSLLMVILVDYHADWQAGWFWSAGLSAVAFAIVALTVDSGPLGNGTTGREPRLPKSPALARMIFSYGLFGFGYVVTATFLVAIVRAGGAGRVFEAVVWMVAGLVAFPSIWLWQVVAARAGIYAAYAGACFVEVVGVVASVALGGYFGPLLASVLLGATFMAVSALGLQAGRLLAPQAPRRVVALMTTSFGIGQIVGPVVAGVLAERSGSFVLPSLLATVVLVASGLCAWDARRHA